MAIGWYLVPYKRLAGERFPVRYCAMDDFTAAIRVEGGDWAETEVLGNRAIVKVRASAASLAAIDAEPGFVRLPKDRLNDSLASLSAGQKTALRNILTDMGYTLAEIQAALGADIGQKTLADVLRFMATRRKKPRYDRDADEIILDGDDQPCRMVESVDVAVR
jgi:hypothetical protein